MRLVRCILDLVLKFLLRPRGLAARVVVLQEHLQRMVARNAAAVDHCSGRRIRGAMAATAADRRRHLLQVRQGAALHVVGFHARPRRAPGRPGLLLFLRMLAVAEPDDLLI